tara:strand:- start:420 stop:875 length:456 start_codon:yes stop_codon:yes gene_type:complete
MSDVFIKWRIKMSDEEKEARKFSCCVIIIEDGKVLLLKRGRTAPVYPSLWGFPGGGSEIGEDLEQCARRETMEETGLEVGELTYVATKVGQTMKNVYFFKTDKCMGDIEMEKVLDEHEDYAWIPLEDLHKYDVTPDTEMMIDKAIKMEKDK